MADDDSIAKAYIDIVARDQSKPAIDNAVRGLHVLAQQSDIIASQIRTLNREWDEANRLTKQLEANAKALANAQRDEGFSFRAQQIREADVITQKYMTDVEKLVQLEEHLKQLYATGALGKTTFYRGMSDIDARRSAMAIAPKDIAAEREHNLLKAQATQLIHNQSSAQDQHNTRLATYDRMLKVNLITQQQHAVAVRNSAQAMRSQSGGVRGDFAFQASYAIQDIATISQMQGMRMADYFRAASNNVSQMMFAIKGLSPAMIGLAGAGVAVGAALVPMVWEAWTESAKKADEQAERSEKTMDRLAKAIERVNQAANLSKRLSALDDMSSGELRKRRSDLGRDIETRRAEVTAAEAIRQQRVDELRRELPFANAAFAGGIGRVQMMGMRLSLQREGVDVRNANEVEAALRRRIAADTSPDDTMRKHYREFLDRYIGGLGTLMGADEALKKAIEARANAERQSKEASEERIAAEKALRDALKFEALDFADKRNAKIADEMSDLRADAAERFRALFNQQQGDLDIIYGRTTPDIAASRDRMRRAIESATQSMLGDSGVVKDRRGLERIVDNFLNDESALFFIKADEARVANRDRSSASFSGFADFGRQFQLALLKPEDEAKQQRERQIKLLEEHAEYLQALAKKADTAFSGAFAQ